MPYVSSLLCTSGLLPQFFINGTQRRSLSLSRVRYFEEGADGSFGPLTICHHDNQRFVVGCLFRTWMIEDMITSSGQTHGIEMGNYDF